MTVAGRQQQAEGWLGQKALLCSMPLVVPRGTWPGSMAVSWPVASLGATRTSPTRLAVSVPDASANHQHATMHRSGAIIHVERFFR